MKASDLIVRCMEAEGVEFIFGIPGEETLDLIDSISKSSIQFIVTRHEQAAAFMADLYGRLTGKPGVCLATLGPGATNLVTGVANAHLDRSPLVAITGQCEISKQHKESHQYIDTIKLFSPITKYNQQITVASTIPDIIRKAFSEANAESPGAVHIQIPTDIAKEEINGAPLLKSNKKNPIIDHSLVENAVNLIEDAENPIILVGNGVIRAGALNEMKKFIEKSNLPMVNSFMAKGILPFEHPRNLFTIGGATYSNLLHPLRNADLVISIGFDIVEFEPTTWNKNGAINILNINSYPAEVDAHYPVLLDLTGDLKNTIMKLTEFITPRPEPEKFNTLRKNLIQQLQDVSLTELSFPYEIMSLLSEQLPEETTLISDVGLHKIWVSNWYQPSLPGKTFIYNGLASMGASLPGGIATKLAEPNSNIVVVTGDGGFLMNAQELETAKRLGINFTIIVFNNQSYGLIKNHQSKANLEINSIGFTNPDFHLFAQSFGLEYRKATNINEFSTALTEAINSENLNLLEVVL
ncbi:acetolactate synthase large subunit [Gottfriedia solisilvae]|uniref:Acetolactate synthase n=1 Tax=Gottfriedia solisilvae TaxID=1516104 RepID=A0A8J3F0F6_9BACI|nr:acetolactate synthase large subunit [Gottfriedia solisilvae]GGI17915.1 acetolactate synthase [Gottfriedia solisilvae]